MSNVTDDPNTTQQLRDKIKSKMEVAKFFAGFITLFLGVAFKDIANLAADPHSWIRLSAQGATLLVLGALAFSVATMFAYDRLMMPPVFWTPRPTDEDLYHQMVRAWQRLFVPAVATFFVGLLGFLTAVTKQFVPSLVLWLVPITAAFLCYRSISRKQNFLD